MQKQTQKKAEKNVGTDAASDLCGAAPRAVGSVLLCHPRDAQGPSGTPPWKAGQLASAAHSQNAQRQKAGGLQLGARGWDSFVLVPAATYVHLTTLLLQY